MYMKFKGEYKNIDKHICLLLCAVTFQCMWNEKIT